MFRSETFWIFCLYVCAAVQYQPAARGGNNRHQQSLLLSSVLTLTENTRHLPGSQTCSPSLTVSPRSSPRYYLYNYISDWPSDQGWDYLTSENLIGDNFVKFNYNWILIMTSMWTLINIHSPDFSWKQQDFYKQHEEVALRTSKRGNSEPRPVQAAQHEDQVELQFSRPARKIRSSVSDSQRGSQGQRKTFEWGEESFCISTQTFAFVFVLDVRQGPQSLVGSYKYFENIPCPGVFWLLSLVTN